MRRELRDHIAYALKHGERYDVRSCENMLQVLEREVDDAENTVMLFVEYLGSGNHHTMSAVDDLSALTKAIFIVRLRACSITLNRTLRSA